MTLLDDLRTGRKDVSSLQIPHLKEGISLFDYQKIAVAAFLSHRKLILYDQMGFGKTCMSFASYVILKQKIPDLKLIYATVKSGIYQAETEFNTFFDGFKTIVVRSDGWTKLRREKIYMKGEHDCYFMGHRRMVLDAKWIAKCLSPCVIVLDESNYFKGLDSKAHKVAAQLRDIVPYMWQLTADPIENSIKDAYGLMDLVDTTLYGDFEQFKQEFCIVKKTRIPKPAKWKSPGFMEIDSVVAYKNKDEFRRRFDLAALGRTRKDVQNELPDLKVRNLEVELPRKDKKIYDEIEEGLLSNLRGYEKLKDHSSSEGAYLENMIRCQQILGCPTEVMGTLVQSLNDVRERSQELTVKKLQQLQEDSEEDYIPNEYDFRFAEHWDDRFKYISSLLANYTMETTAKCEEIKRLLQDELPGEKVIIFSSFLKVIDYLEPRLDDWKPLRITGAENAQVREKNRRQFVESEDRNVLLVTTAALRGLNLQRASCIICHDIPMTWGKLRQLVGRIIRTGSLHEMVNLIILIAKGTIDQTIHKKLYSTQQDVERILGDLDKDKIVTGEMVRSHRF